MTTHKDHFRLPEKNKKVFLSPHTAAFTDECMIRMGMETIQNIIDFCQQKYGNLFNSSLFLKALVFFNDAEEQEIQQIDHHWQQIKKFFLQLTKCYIDDISRHG